MFCRPKILFLVSLLFVALLNPKFNPYLLFKFLIFIILKKDDDYKKGGIVTKPIIVVKMPGCKLLYIIQVKGTSWPYLISNVLVTLNHSYNAASDWPCTFFTARL